MPFTEFLTDLSDRIFGRFASRFARRYARELDVPEHFVEMLLLIEDKRFSVHCGVDPIAIVRAAVFNLRGCALQGASTIPQQVFRVCPRRVCGATRRRTLGEKARQSLWSVYQSLITPKRVLLRKYIDNVYWGGSIYGLDAAARAYFHTGRNSLSVAQSFFLAERIAMPNGFSFRRVSNLVRRRAIRNALHRRSASGRDVASLYEAFSNLGGDLWQSLER